MSVQGGDEIRNIPIGLDFGAIKTGLEPQGIQLTQE